jgi:hypothetical protein
MSEHDMATEIDNLNWNISDAMMEIANLRATIADLVKALETAKRQLVTLGGDARWDAYGDKIHSTVLHRIDIALAKAKQP